MTGVQREDVLVLIALFLEHRGHTVIGDDPVVHVVAHDIWIKEILVGDLHPDADGLGFGARNQRLVIANADITNQELINQSVALVYGVRIAVTLQLAG